MNRYVWSLCLAALAYAPVAAAPPAARANATAASAADVLQALAGTTPVAIPHALLENAQGLVIIPHVLKAGFVVGGRRGHGVVLSRDARGVWSNPAFITLTGGSIGWQVGVQSTDIVLVFKTRKGLQRLLQGKGKLTLGADAAIAAGPVGRQAEADTDGRLRAEIYSYSRSRGLFAGLSLEGASLAADREATAAYYPIVSVPAPNGGLVQQQAVPATAVQLRGIVIGLTTPPAPVIAVPLPPPAVPPPPPPGP